MSQKRQPYDEASKEGTDESFPEEKRQKVPALRGVINEVIRAENIKKFLQALEPLIRRVVREEVESALGNHFPKTERQIERETIPLSPSTHYSSNSRILQLQFTNKLSLPIFTGAKIEGENSSPISISLIDSVTGQTVTSLSLKVEIVVLEGDFEVGERENNWSVQEFRSYIVREREGRRSLLTGEVLVELNQGLGFVGELSFTDNSSWTRSRRFKLGARSEEGYINGMRVREAISEPFMVKDHRGELYKKHYPPSLDDEVWRVEKIGKDGAFHKRLTSHNINTVRDFLTLLSLDPAKLRNILGNGISAKMWEVVIEHARTCTLTDEFQIYQMEGEGKKGIVFNVVGELKGIISKLGKFVSIDDLTEKEQAEAHAAAKLAYTNWDKVSSCDSSTLLSNNNKNDDDYDDDDDNNNNNNNNNNKSYPFNPMSPPSIRDDTYTNQSQAGPANFSVIHSTVPSPDIFALSSIGKETRDGSTFYDECSSQLYFDGDCGPLMDNTSIMFDPADLGAALRGFLGAPIGISHVKACRVGWRTLSSVLGWIFYIKKVVARRKKLNSKERLCM